MQNENTITQGMIEALATQDVGAWEAALAIKKILENTTGIEGNIKKQMFDFLRCKHSNLNAAEMYLSGVCYVNGFGIKKDFAIAIDWYQRSLAADKINYLRIRKYAFLWPLGQLKRYSEENDLARELIDENINDDITAAALINLGFNYLRGLGVKKDARLAIEYTTRAVLLGDASAIHNLGIYYAGCFRENYSEYNEHLFSLKDSLFKRNTEKHLLFLVLAESLGHGGSSERLNSLSSPIIASVSNGYGGGIERRSYLPDIQRIRAIAEKEDWKGYVEARVAARENKQKEAKSESVPCTSTCTTATIEESITGKEKENEHSPLLSNSSAAFFATQPKTESCLPPTVMKYLPTEDEIEEAVRLQNSSSCCCAIL